MRPFWRPPTRPPDMNCRELVRVVTDYLENALPPSERARFEAHLRECEGCTTYLEQMRATISGLGHLDEADIDPQARAELLTAFRDWHRESG